MCFMYCTEHLKQGPNSLTAPWLSAVATPFQRSHLLLISQELFYGLLVDSRCGLKTQLICFPAAT